MNKFEKEIIKKLDTIMDYIQLQPKESIETKQEITAKTLIWGETSKEPMTWEEAKEWCEEQGGRLPTRLELQQAYEDKVEGFKENCYWSATENNRAFAYYVNFYNGNTYFFDKTFAPYVRCVRSK